MNVLALWNSDGTKLPMSLAPSMTREEEASWPESAQVAEKRRLLLLVRLTLTVGVASVVLYDNSHPTVFQVAITIGFLVSNLLVALLPAWIIATMAFDVGVVLVDTVVTSFAMYATPQAGTDVLLMYFAIILMASIGDRLSLNVVACVVTAAAYCAFLLSHSAASEILRPSVLLRFPFLLVVGAFYGFFVDRARRARDAAQKAAARQRARTEFLASLTTDIQAPLEGARRSAGALRKQMHDSGDDKQRRLADQVLSNLRVVSDLIGLVPHEGGHES